MSTGLELYQCRAFTRDRVYFLAFDPPTRIAGVSNTQILILRDLVKWQFRSVQWEAVGVTFQDYDAVIVGKYGQVLVGTKTGFLMEDIGTSVLQGELPGAVRSVSTVTGEAYAVGMAREVFVRSPNGSWVQRREGLPSYDPRYPGVGFNAVTSDAQSKALVAGWSGEVYRLEPPWQPIEMPTNLAFFAATTSAEHGVVLVGQVGTLVTGGANAWKAQDYVGPHPDWRAVVEFQGCLFLSDGETLFRYEDGSVKQVLFGTVPVPSISLTSCSDVLITISQNAAWVTSDAVEWQKINLP